MVDNGIIHKQNLQDYFDGVGFDRWSAIYGGDESLSYIRQTVQRGHAAMLEQAHDWLRDDLPQTLFDAGCGTGLFSIAMAQQGSRVTAVDISPRMVAMAQADATAAGVQENITFSTGDIALVDGQFDVVACFDVLVHYPPALFADLCTSLAQRSKKTLLFTYAPYSHLLAALHWLGGYFPRGDRRTEIQMIKDHVVAGALADAGLSITRTSTISDGFYHVKLVQADRS